MGWLASSPARPALGSFLALAISAGCASAVVRQSSGADSGGAASQSDAGLGGGGGGGSTGPHFDAGLPPLAMVDGVLGNLVLDGKSLVTTRRDFQTQAGSLIRADVQTWAVTTILADGPGLYIGAGLTADAARFYFFGSSAPAPGNAGIYAYPRAGGAPTRLTGVGTLSAHTGPFTLASSIAVDATRVFWIEHGADPTQDQSTLMAAPIAGGPGAALYALTPPEAMLGSLAVDATSIYFTTIVWMPTSAVSAYALPLAGGPPAQIWTTSDATYVGQSSIVADGTGEYVIDQGPIDTDCSPFHGTVFRLHDPDPPVIEASLISGVGPAAIAGGTAYVGSAASCNESWPVGTLARIPSPGSQTVLASGLWSPISIVVDGKDVYWDAALYDPTKPNPGILVPSAYGFLHATQ
jgi:hypothetical protein